MNTSAISVNFIKTTFSSSNFYALFSGEKTHTPALKFIKEIVRYTTDKDFILNLIKAGLPADYNKDTLKETAGMVSWCLENGFDELDKSTEEGKSPSMILLNLVEKEKVELFHNELMRPYIQILEKGRKTILPLTSQISKRWLYRLFYLNIGRPISDQGFKQGLQLLEAKALFDCPEYIVHLRHAHIDEGIVINLCNEEKDFVVINKDGYTITKDSPVKFYAPPSLASIPNPIATNTNVLKELQDLLALNDDIFYRVLAFIIGSMRSVGPYFCLLTEGEQGSGKSFLCYMIKMIVDPSHAPKLRMPDKEHDLMIQSKDNSLLLFDNMSGLKAEMSDALCTLATGGGMIKRKLYTDDESFIFKECRPFICNGITGIATRPDLLERSISFRLPSMPQEKRKTEYEILKKFEEIQPRLMDKLFKILSYALKNFENTPTPNQFRMADAARWIQAAEPETGLQKGTLLNALQDSQNDIIKEAISNNSLAQAIYKVAEYKPFEGLVGNLLVLLREASENSRFDKSFPNNPAHLSHALNRLMPALTKSGINVEFGPKTRQGKMVKIWLSDNHIFGG